MLPSLNLKLTLVTYKEFEESRNLKGLIVPFMISTEGLINVLFSEKKGCDWLFNMLAELNATAVLITIATVSKGYVLTGIFATIFTPSPLKLISCNKP